MMPVAWDPASAARESRKALAVDTAVSMVLAEADSTASPAPDLGL